MALSVKVTPPCNYMIENNKQYKNTKKWLRSFEKNIRVFNLSGRYIMRYGEKLTKAEYDALWSMVVDLSVQIAVYETKKGIFKE